MKILWFTDSHATAKNPNSRLDIYYKSVLAKFTEVGQIAKQEQATFIVCTGDLFHTPNVSTKFAGELAEIIRTWKVPFLCVPGNHDVFGYNISTIDQTMLGLLAKNGTVRLLTRANSVKFKVGNKTVSLEGQEYFDEIDLDPVNYEPTVQADFNIIAAHGMLLDKPYLPNVPHTLISSIMNPADITVVGHYHPGFKEVSSNGGMFFNPESLLRVEANSHNKTAMPKVLITDLQDAGNNISYTYKYIQLQCAKPGPDVFDYNAKQIVQQQTNIMAQFKSLTQNNSNSTMSINNTVNQVLLENKNLDKDIIAKTYDYLQQAQLSASNDLASKGFIEEPTRLFIEEVGMVNFQSHENTVVNFVNGFNSIIGESNMGKTSIARLIRWILTDKPKGSDFIMTGKDTVSGYIKMSNGIKVTRERDRKSAGKYVIEYADGTSKSFSGFGNEVPMDVINALQMPYINFGSSKTSLNLAEQLDGPFFIGSSAADRAVAMGQIIGADVLDDAISKVSKEVLASTKKVNVLETEAKRLETELKTFDDLEDRKNHIIACETVLKQISETEKQIAELESLSSELSSLEQEIQHKNTSISTFNYLPTLEGALDKIEKFLDSLQYADDLINEYEEVVQEIATISCCLGKHVDIDRLSKAIQKATAMCDQVSEYELLLEEYNQLEVQVSILDNQVKANSVNVDVEALSKEVEEIKVLEELLKEINGYDTQINLYSTQINRDKELVEESEQKLIKAKEDLVNYLKENNICPLCNRELDNDTINHIVCN